MPLLTDASVKTVRLRKALRRQGGVAMIEMVAGLTLAGSAAAVMVNHHQSAEDLAIHTHAELTAAAISSAVNLQQAKWAVSGGVNSLLSFNAIGIATGVDADPAASEQDCQALWQNLIVPQPVLEGAQRFWQVAPEAVVGSVRCQFTYRHHKMPSISVFYNTQTGRTAFK